MTSYQEPFTEQQGLEHMLTILEVFDNNTSTYFDAVDASNSYAGIDLVAGNEKKITKIRFYPRASWASRMVGGKFQGSNTSPTRGFVDLHTISSTPTYS